MPEKGSNYVSLYIFRPNSWFSRPFTLLTVSVFLGMLIVWSIDGRSIRNGIKVWQNRGDYLALKRHNPANLAPHNSPSSLNSTQVEQISLPNSTQCSSPLSLNLTQLEPVSTLNSNQNSSHSWAMNSTELESVSPHNVGHIYDEPHQNSTQSKAPHAFPTSLNWISVELEPNFTSNLLAGWLAPGGEPCRESRTVEIEIPGLDDQNSTELSTGEIHEFVIHALDDAGKPHCLGGDYFEIDLSGESWKSRPPIKDFGNGSYSFSLQVHPHFAGEYNLTIVLLFRHFEGLKFSPVRFVFWKELRQIAVKFYKTSTKLPELQICKKSDFFRDVWSGRWTRHGRNDECQIDLDGRYRCLEPNFPCQNSWCNGSLGSLESNGWVYSTHCSFRIFSAESAWECLQNRWIFFWGDSNHVDSIRNMLNFILGLPEIKSVPRRFDMNFTNPTNTSQSVRITSIFNGHWNETQNYEGLNSLQNEEFRELLKQYFSEQTVPDTMIMNSGLHDGVHWKNIRAFAKGAEYAAKFWKDVMESVKQRGMQVPKFIFRTTIATGGYARSLAFNPNKMEAFNGVILDQLKRVGILSGVIDDFDMTFPWHYDNRCNDGVHYGRAPAKMKWRDGEIGHQYFVDLMLGHVLLNTLCAS